MTFQRTQLVQQIRDFLKIKVYAKKILPKSFRQQLESIWFPLESHPPFVGLFLCKYGTFLQFGDLFLMWTVVEIISCFEVVNLLSKDKPVIGDAS